MKTYDTDENGIRETGGLPLGIGITILIFFAASAIFFLYVTWNPIKYHESAVEYFKKQVAETPDLITLIIGFVMVFFVFMIAKKMVKRNNDYMRRKEAGRGNNY